MRRLISLLGTAAAVLALGAPVAGAKSVLSLDKFEETGRSLITNGTDMSGYIAEATVTAGKATETCGPSLPVMASGGDMLKNYSAKDEIAYPFGVRIPGECSGTVRLQHAEAPAGFETELSLGGVSVTKGATLSLTATENAAKHFYPAAFASSVAKPFVLDAEETFGHPGGFICEYKGTKMAGSHSPAGEKGIDGATVKGTFKRVTPEPTSCPKSLAVTLVWIILVPGDTFNPYVYGFVEP
jgi:hypothetical protein